MKEDHGWIWEAAQQRSFEAIKKELTSYPVLAFYTPEATHTLQVDASTKGIGGVLPQNGRPIMYISRALTKTEQNYSNIERELLSVVFGLERLYNFVYGGKIILQTDHKPLVGIFHKNVSEISPRLQRMMLRIYKYDVQLQYLPGKENVIADALSRVSTLNDSHTALEPIPLHLLTSSFPGTPDCVFHLRTATSNDSQLSQIRHYIIHEWPQQGQNALKYHKSFGTTAKSFLPKKA